MQIQAGSRVSLPPKTTSYQEWASRLTEHARRGISSQELDFWRMQTETNIAEPWGELSNGENREESVDVHYAWLTPEETTDLLRHAPRKHSVGLDSLLLTGLHAALAEWLDMPAVPVLMVHHGREHPFPEVDVGRTIGWFMTSYPLVLRLERGASPSAQLAATHEQLAAVPGQGLGFGIARYLGEGRNWQQPYPPAISFNYQGQYDQVFKNSRLYQASDTAYASSRHPSNDRNALVLNVWLRVVRERLRLGIRYSRRIHTDQEIAAVADRYIGCLRQLLGD